MHCLCVRVCVSQWNSKPREAKGSKFLLPLCVPPCRPTKMCVWKRARPKAIILPLIFPFEIKPQRACMRESEEGERSRVGITSSGWVGGVRGAMLAVATLMSNRGGNFTFKGILIICQTVSLLPPSSSWSSVPQGDNIFCFDWFEKLLSARLALKCFNFTCLFHFPLQKHSVHDRTTYILIHLRTQTIEKTC